MRFIDVKSIHGETVCVNAYQITGVFCSKDTEGWVTWITLSCRTIISIYAGDSEKEAKEKHKQFVNSVNRGIH